MMVMQKRKQILHDKVAMLNYNFNRIIIINT